MTEALQDITVLEVSGTSSGSFCTMMLACMGAEVLKIEAPDVGERPIVSAYLDRNKREPGSGLETALPVGRFCTNWPAAPTYWWKVS